MIIANPYANLKTPVAVDLCKMCKGSGLRPIGSHVGTLGYIVVDTWAECPKCNGSGKNNEE